MMKYTKYFAYIILFILIVAIILILSINTENDENNTVIDELKIGGLVVAFEEGVTEKDARSVIENYDLIRNNTFKYNYSKPNFYTIVDKNNFTMGYYDKLLAKNWIDRGFIIKKDGYYIIGINGPVNDEVLETLDAHNLKLKQLMWGYIKYVDTNNWINVDDATKIKNELEKNEMILVVYFDYFEK